MLPADGRIPAVTNCQRDGVAPPTSCPGASPAPAVHCIDELPSAADVSAPQGDREVFVSGARGPVERDGADEMGVTTQEWC